MIVIDALRARNLGCYGYSKSTSSTIDSIASQGVLFSRAYSCNVVTDSSLTTILSGRYPMTHGIIRHGDRIRKEEILKLEESDIRLISEILKLRGYTTLAVDWLGRWHRRGFDYYSGMLRKTKPIRFPVKRIEARLDGFFRGYASLKKSNITDDAGLVTCAAETLVRSCLQKKFFLLIHYWDTHRPYAPPTSYYKKVGEGTNGFLKGIANPMLLGGRFMREWTIQENIARYDAGIAYVDDHIGKLIETLEDCGIMDETLIILTSDHGESLTEHQICFQHHGLYDVTIHVPLILRYPDYLPTGKKVTALVQHFDIVPTILDILDIEYENLDGKSLMPLMYGETDQLHPAVYAEEAYYQRKRAIRTHDYKYIRALSKKGALCTACLRVHGGIEELYDLTKDPEERTNIADEAPNVASSLKAELLQWTNSLGIPETALS